MPDSNGQLKEPTTTNLTSSQELDTSSGNSTSKVNVRVKMAGQAALPQQMQILLRNAKGKVTGAEVDATGQANFTDVIPGKYDVLAGAQNDVYSVTGIAWDGGRTSGRSLDVQPGASLSASVSPGKAIDRSRASRERNGRWLCPAKRKSGGRRDGGIDSEKSGSESRSLPPRPDRSRWQFHPL